MHRRARRAGYWIFRPTLSDRGLLTPLEPIVDLSSLVSPHFSPSRRVQTDFSQRAHAREVVGRHGQHKQLINSFQPAHHHLTHAPTVLTQPKPCSMSFLFCTEMA